jgi:hypothetical protein
MEDYDKNYLHHGFAKHDNVFRVGQKVKTRRDIGGFMLVVVEIHNGSYCTVRGYGKDRHMNMAFIEPVI